MVSEDKSAPDSKLVLEDLEKEKSSIMYLPI